MEERKLDEKLERFDRLMERLELLADEQPQKPHPKPEPKPHEKPHPKPHHPHHELDLNIEFDNSKKILEDIFGDEDTTKAVVELMKKSPLEIQIVFKTMIDLHKKIDEFLEY